MSGHRNPNHNNNNRPPFSKRQQTPIIRPQLHVNHANTPQPRQRNPTTAHHHEHHRSPPEHKPQTTQKPTHQTVIRDHHLPNQQTIGSFVRGIQNPKHVTQNQPNIGQQKHTTVQHNPQLPSSPQKPIIIGTPGQQIRLQSHKSQSPESGICLQTMTIVHRIANQLYAENIKTVYIMEFYRHNGNEELFSKKNRKILESGAMSVKCEFNINYDSNNSAKIESIEFMKSEYYEDLERFSDKLKSDYCHWYFKIPDILFLVDNNHSERQYFENFMKTNLKTLGTFIYLSNFGQLCVNRVCKEKSRPNDIEIDTQSTINEVMPKLLMSEKNNFAIARIYQVIDVWSCGIESGVCRPKEPSLWNRPVGGVENIVYDEKELNKYTVNFAMNRFILKPFFGLFVGKNACVVVTSECNRCVIKREFNVNTEHYTRTLFTNLSFVVCEGELCFEFAAKRNAFYTRQQLANSNILKPEYNNTDKNYIYFLSAFDRETTKSGFSIDRVWHLQQIGVQHKRKYGVIANWSLLIGDNACLEAIEEYETGIREVKCRQFADPEARKLWLKYIEFPARYEPKEFPNLKNEMKQVIEAITRKRRVKFALHMNQALNSKASDDYNYYKPTTNETDILTAKGEEIYKVFPESMMKLLAFKTSDTAMISKLNNYAIALLNFQITAKEMFKYKPQFTEQLIPSATTVELHLKDNIRVSVPEKFKVGHKLSMLLRRDCVSNAFVNKVSYHVVIDKNKYDLCVELTINKDTSKLKQWKQTRVTNNGYYDLLEYEDQQHIYYTSALFVVFYRTEQTQSATHQKSK